VGSAASSRSGRCKSLTLVRRSSAQRRRSAPAGRNKSRVALRAACIRGDRGRTECDRHRGGATTARERLQVGPSREGMRSHFTFALSQTRSPFGSSTDSSELKGGTAHWVGLLQKSGDIDRLGWSAVPLAAVA